MIEQELRIKSTFLHLYYKYILNIYVKVSAGARHYLPRKVSLKLCYVMLVMLGLIQLGSVI